uniref:Secreted venom protein family 5 protein n=1 Tax=Pristhesancus plagipennis TaxID=1955184 RepID=A0A2K8JML5_PRIPG|nr:secreted venom protein family 5 protein [Pristhesancus plagipennis]
MELTLRVATFVCMLALAMGSTHYNINKEVEALLVNLNELLASKKMDTSVIPDLGVEAAPVFIGTTVRDFTTMYRTGDCELWVDGENLKIKMNVGLKQMTVHVFLVPYLGGPGTYSFEGASAEVGLTLKPNEAGSCTTDWDYLNITTLGNVLTHTFNKQYDGKSAPEEMTKLIIPYYNKYFNNNEIFSIKNLNKFLNICDHTETTFRKYLPKINE